LTLTQNDAKIILGMVARGDKRHDIAAWLGVNQARIKEAEDGLFGTLEMAKPNELPPKGAPGVKGQDLLAFVKKAIAALDAGNAEEAKRHLNAGVARFNQHE